MTNLTKKMTEYIFEKISSLSCSRDKAQEIAETVIKNTAKKIFRTIEEEYYNDLMNDVLIDYKSFVVLARKFEVEL